MKHTPDTIKRTFVIFLLIAPFASAQTTHYVDADAPGNNDGTSWTNAYHDLQSALRTATEGDRILVAAGTYRPAGPGDVRTVSFELVSGVGLFGGYAGYGEQNPDARDFDAYETVLSGDLNGDDGQNFENNGENSFNVIRAVAASSSTELDGFTITGGNANGLAFHNQHAGGGYFGVECDTIVRNCRFNKNHAQLGGGVCDFDSEGVYESCTFVENEAETGGGGMFRFGGKATLLNCEFLKNAALEGGGMSIVENTEPTLLVDCLFEANRATGSRGGGLREEGLSSTDLIGCTFVGNESPQFGGGYLKGERGETAFLTGCLFERNVSAEGGGIANRTNVVDLARCSFTDNTADKGGAVAGNSTSTGCTFVANDADFGGAIYARSATVHGSAFSGNVATVDGGAVYAMRDEFVTNSLFRENVAGDDGGALFSQQRSDVRRSVFVQNAAAGNGGAMFSGVGTVSDSLFAYNVSSGDGGAVFARLGTTVLMGTTISRNSAGGAGGGLYIQDGDRVEFSSGIIWGNEPDQLFVASRQSRVVLHHSIVEGGYAGEGNMEINPQFVDPDAENFQLRPTSPAINRGDPAFEAEAGEGDLDGHWRVLCDRVDIGAYEFGIGDFDCNRDVSLDDFGGWDDCFTGPGGGPYPATCEAFDFDADQDVDLRDFAGFAARYPN